MTVPRYRVSQSLLATRQTAAAAPVVLDPAEAQPPLRAIPVEAGHAQAATRAPQKSAGEDDVLLATHLRRDLILVFQHVDAVDQAELRLELLRALAHRLAVHVRLAAIKEPDVLELAHLELRGLVEILHNGIAVLRGDVAREAPLRGRLGLHLLLSHGHLLGISQAESSRLSPGGW